MPTPGVLVIDDEPMVRDVLRRGLEFYGARVWVAAGGREALDVFRRHRGDIGVVLCDVRLPGPGGPEVLAALRALEPGRPGCLMTADLSAAPGAERSLAKLRRWQLVGNRRRAPRGYYLPDNLPLFRHLCRA